MPARGGRWFGILAIEGHTALIILVQVQDSDEGQGQSKFSPDICIVTRYTTVDLTVDQLGNVMT
jgi:hypothetical protein